MNTQLLVWTALLLLNGVNLVLLAIKLERSKTPKFDLTLIVAAAAMAIISLYQMRSHR